MNCKIVENSKKRYIEMIDPITCESDVLDIIGMCIAYGADRLLLREEAFTDDFLNLKSGLAGIVLQKFTNYHIKVSAIIKDESIVQERFKELVYELNKTDCFMFFNNRNDAENWIMNG